MPVRVNCPGCQAAYVLPDEQRGKVLRCAKCQKAFRVGGAPPPVVAVTAVEAEPVRAAPPRRPAPAEAVPAAPSRRGGGALLLVGVLVVVLFLLCGGVTVVAGGVYWFYLRGKPSLALSQATARAAEGGAPRSEPAAAPATEREKAAPAAPTQPAPTQPAAPPSPAPQPAPTRPAAPAPVRPAGGPAPGGADDLLKDQSTLPVKAVVGKPFSYQFPNSSGMLKYELLPQFKQRYPGLDLTPGGLLTWTPPVGTSAGPLNLMVAIDHRLYTYRLEVGEDAESALAPGVVGGWAMLPDGVTLVVSVPDKAQLVYVDTVANKESQRVTLDFKPSAVAFQGGQLFVAAEGSSQLYVLDFATGAVQKQVRVSEAPLLALACHPEKGPVYASNAQKQVWAVDPAAGRATDTHAQGMFLAVDPVAGDALYTGIQGPIKDVIVVRRVGGDHYTVQPGVQGEHALLLKYAVKDGALQPVSANDNAATNGKVLRLSPDGKRVGIAGGGGYRPGAGAGGATVPGYGIALFQTDDVKAVAGVVACGAYPDNLAFHPVLDLGVAEQTGLDRRLHFFNSKSLVETDTLAFGQGNPAGQLTPDQLMAASKAQQAHLLAFGGKGTKLVYYDAYGATPYLRFLPLKLSDQDREALAKAYGK